MHAHYRSQLRCQYCIYSECLGDTEYNVNSRSGRRRTCCWPTVWFQDVSKQSWNPEVSTTVYTACLTVDLQSGNRLVSGFTSSNNRTGEGRWKQRGPAGSNTAVTHDRSAGVQFSHVERHQHVTWHTHNGQQPQPQQAAPSRYALSLQSNTCTVASSRRLLRITRGYGRRKIQHWKMTINAPRLVFVAVLPLL